MRQSNTRSKPYVIGIAGGSASGKSTFAQQLETALESLSVESFHMDSYFKPQEARPYAKAHVTGKMYTDDNHPETADLPKLRADLAKAIDTAASDVIIVEGLLVLHDDNIFEKLDLKLFIDCRPDERIVRRLKRNMAWGLAFDEISGVYLDMVRYRHDQYVEPSKWRADLIINGSSFSSAALALIVDGVRSQFSQHAKA